MSLLITTQQADPLTHWSPMTHYIDFNGMNNHLVKIMTCWMFDAKPSMLTYCQLAPWNTLQCGLKMGGFSFKNAFESVVWKKLSIWIMPQSVVMIKVSSECRHDRWKHKHLLLNCGCLSPIIILISNNLLRIHTFSTVKLRINDRTISHWLNWFRITEHLSLSVPYT